MGMQVKHLTGLRNLDAAAINRVLDTAEEMRSVVSSGGAKLLSDKLLATFFYEPSTRTRMSFEAAMHRLGGGVISMADAQTTSSVQKGETLKDTIKTIDKYADVIALRHPDAGAAQEAADVSAVPVLNAGDGTNEHPTQALLDFFTIREEFGSLDGLTVTLCGDLKHTRATNSIALGLGNYDVKLQLVSPPELRITDPIKEAIEAKGRATLSEFDDVRDAVPKSNVLYVTRIQKERLAQPEDYDRYKGSYIVDREVVDLAEETMLVMHHLPRVGELSEDVDDYPGARYFQQPFNGVLVRMALLALYLDRA